MQIGKIGVSTLYFVLFKFNGFFQSWTDLTSPEYCKKLKIMLLYACFNSSYVKRLPSTLVISLI